MRLLTLLLVPAALIAGQPRYARLGEFQGQVEVQLTAADPWMPAERNLPLAESAWLRTGAGARLEIELDDGGAWRLGPDSLGEISDYTRLSTGQQVTLLSLDHGTAYFTGQPKGKDALRRWCGHPDDRDAGFADSRGRRSYAGIAGARDGLHGGDDHLGDAERLERPETHGQPDRRAIRVGHDLPFPTAYTCCSGTSLRWSGSISGTSSGTSRSMRWFFEFDTTT